MLQHNAGDPQALSLAELRAVLVELADMLRDCAAGSPPATRARMLTLSMTFAGYARSLGDEQKPGDRIVALLKVDDACHAVSGLGIERDNARWRDVGEDHVQRVFDLTVPLRKKLAREVFG